MERKIENGKGTGAILGSYGSFDPNINNKTL